MNIITFPYSNNNNRNIEPWMMKKKQDKKEERNEMLTLSFLEKKYQDQKHILMTQNTSLSQQLMKEIQRANTLANKCQQLQKELNIKNDNLLRENQILRAELDDLLHRNEQQISITNTEDQLQLLKEQKKLTLQNQQLQDEKQQLQTIIEIIYKEKNDLQKQITRYKQNESTLQKEIQTLAEKHNQYKHQSLTQITQLQGFNQNYQEEIQKLNSKLTQQKKKKREFQKKISELSVKINQNQRQEQKDHLQQIQLLTKDTQKYHQKTIQLNTKLTLSQAKAKQLQEFINQLQAELKDQLKKHDKQKELNSRYKEQNERLIEEISELEGSIKMLKERQRTVQNNNENLTLINSKSYKNNQFRESQEVTFQKVYQGSSKQLDNSYHTTYDHQGAIRHERSLQSIKISTQLNTLQAQLSQSKKELQSTAYELKSLKKDMQAKHYELMQKQERIRQIKQKHQRIQAQKNRQILLLRKDSIFLKGKQTELLQKAKELSDYESSMSLKLSFYQRKIKEHLDTIDRKENIIQKYKLNASLFEQKQKEYQQTLRRLTDDLQGLRGFKQECQRKETLLKQYKAKIQKYREEKEVLEKDYSKVKNDNSKLKTDKQRVQTQLQIKQKQWSSMKNRQQKGNENKQEDNAKQYHRLKQSKTILDNKVKQLKRQKDELSQALQDIRSVIFNKVDEMISKEISAHPKKKHNQEYEAAKLLGLKPADLDEFLNPATLNSQRISRQLQQNWHGGNFSDFINNFLNFLQLKQPTI